MLDSHDDADRSFKLLFFDTMWMKTDVWACESPQKASCSVHLGTQQQLSRLGMCF